ncbi:hypothetical protein HDU79_011516 [Rhizoclosmatium sp. JEL0117]|nr:hypothetical protein HDU79_011513 [Rhizoclosmatium sp. JEL0117]KAJ3294079.1 hypothetical protein HDU79_011516 [Rhizoclosmatium sp. JEL0117]
MPRASKSISSFLLGLLSTFLFTPFLSIISVFCCFHTPRGKAYYLLGVSIASIIQSAGLIFLLIIIRPQAPTICTAVVWFLDQLKFFQDPLSQQQQQQYPTQQKNATSTLVGQAETRCRDAIEKDFSFFCVGVVFFALMSLGLVVEAKHLIKNLRYAEAEEGLKVRDMLGDCEGEAAAGEGGKSGGDGGGVGERGRRRRQSDTFVDSRASSQKSCATTGSSGFKKPDRRMSVQSEGKDAKRLNLVGAVAGKLEFAEPEEIGDEVVVSNRLPRESQATDGTKK